MKISAVFGDFISYEKYVSTAVICFLPPFCVSNVFLPFGVHFQHRQGQRDSAIRIISTILSNTATIKAISKHQTVSAGLGLCFCKQFIRLLFRCI